MNIDTDLTNERVSRLLLKSELDLDDLKFIVEFLSSRNDVLWDDVFDVCRSAKAIGDEGMAFLTDRLLCRESDSHIKSFCIQILSHACLSTEKLRKLIQPIGALEESYTLKTPLGVEAFEARIHIMKRIGMPLKSSLVATLKSKEAKIGVRIWVLWQLCKLKALKKGRPNVS